MRDIEHLKEQMERARRLAAGPVGTADGNRLLALADDYQRQIDAAIAPREMQQSMSKDQEADETATTSDCAATNPDEEPEMG
jgi:hypothetical protein